MTVRLGNFFKVSYTILKIRTSNCILVKQEFTLRCKHMGKTQMIKRRNLRGNSRVSDQLPMIKISSVIKNIYTLSNQYLALQLKNPCCHGNSKRSQLWHSKAVTETSLLWNDQQARVLYKKCLSIFSLKTKCCLKYYFQILLPQISCKLSLKPDHIYRHCPYKMR